MNDLFAAAGNTPVIELKRIAAKYGAAARIFGKYEAANPCGSIKDRIAAAMIEDALQKGLIKSGVIVEPTSGNTGIGLAAYGAAKGCRVILTMPDTMSVERRKLMALLGAEVVLTPGAQGMRGAIARAAELSKELNAFLPGQFTNPVNPLAHYRSTGPEIFRQVPDTAVLVSAVGTGGTVSGAGRFLKEQNPNIHVVAVEPALSAVLSGGTPGAHKIQGIGAGFIPDILDRSVIDEVIAVTEDAAFTFQRELASCEGLLCGISSGAALAAAVETAKRKEYAGCAVVVILPDTGERYLSKS